MVETDANHAMQRNTSMNGPLVMLNLDNTRRSFYCGLNLNKTRLGRGREGAVN